MTTGNRTRCLCGLLWILGCAALAQPADVPSVSALDSQITALEAASPATGTDEASALSLLTSARQRMLAKVEAEERLASAIAEREGAAKRIDELEQIRASRGQQPTRSLTGLSLTEIDQRISDRNAELRAWLSRSTALQSTLREAVGRDLGKELAAARLELEQLTPRDTPAEMVLSRTAAAQLFAVEKSLARVRVDYLETLTAQRSERQSAARRELELLTLLIEQTQNELAQLNESELARTVAEANEERSTTQQLRAEFKKTELTAPQLNAWLKRNRTLGTELRDILIQSRSVEALEQRTRAALDRLQNLKAGLSEQLDQPLYGDSPKRGAALLRQRERLDAESTVGGDLTGVIGQLSDARLRQFDLLDTSQNAWGMSAAELLDGLQKAEATALLPLASDALIQQRRLIDRLSQVYAEYTEQLALIEARNSQLRDTSGELRNLIDRNLLWSRNAEALSLGTFSSAATQSIALFRDSLAGARSAASRMVLQQPLWSIPLLGLVGLLFWGKSNHSAQLRQMVGDLGRVQRDRFSYTLRAFWLTILLAAPIPLLIALPALVEVVTGQPERPLRETLWLVAGLVFAALFLRQSLRPGGLALAHFRWSEPLVNRIRIHLRWFLPGFLLTVTGAIYLNSLDQPDLSANLERLVFLATLIITGAGCWSLFRTSRAASSNTLLRDPAALTALGIAAITLALGGLSILGYQYSAKLLSWRALTTGLVLLSVLYLYALLLRAIAISERRIALDRARERRAALASNQQQGLTTESEEGTINVDIDRIDLQSISAQSRALAWLGMVVATVFAAAAVWSDFPVVFQPLQSVTLWEITTEVDGVPTRDPVTLWHLFVAIVVSAVAYIGVRNIPGTLEVAVLNRLPLAPGTGYAITSVTSYLIVIVGAVTVLQLLGAQWSKLQWLVAALSVGLGFGLQEIVANFVSGLLILFERPVRLGDVVTIGDQTGVVTRIRIRATTVMDWDRREILIPNKSFITERLINWTLTDSVTRAIIYVGVAYGSDVELVERTLHEIAEGNPKVLTEPPPAVLFLGFGDSSLSFEMRIFVAALGDSLSTRHELHKSIDARFRELGIEISFPQRDLHLDSTTPLEIAIVEQRPGTQS